MNEKEKKLKLFKLTFTLLHGIGGIFDALANRES